MEQYKVLITNFRTQDAKNRWAINKFCLALIRRRKNITDTDPLGTTSSVNKRKRDGSEPVYEQQAEDFKAQKPEESDGECTVGSETSSGEKLPKEDHTE